MPERILQLLHCLTPLHNGSGTGVDVIDRPILRETTTGFPIVQASTIKGALRAEAGPKESPPSEVGILFGEGSTNGRMGSLQITDAMVLAFPVPSLAGIYAWATCPLQLARFRRLLQIAGAEEANLVGKVLEDSATGQDGVIGCPAAVTGSGAKARGVVSLTVGGGNGKQEAVCLEGWVLKKVSKREQLGELAKRLGAWLYPEDAYWQKELINRLVVVDNTVYEHLVKHATELQANIAIEDSGVTKDGSLRYTEYLPAETLLCSLMTLSGAENTGEQGAESNGGGQEGGRAVRDLLQKLIGLIRPAVAGNTKIEAETGADGATAQAGEKMVQLGADETTGKGLVRSLAISFGGGA